MGFSIYLALCYCVIIYMRLIVGFSCGHRMDHDCKDTPNSPENEDVPSPNPVEVSLSDEEVNIFTEDSNSMTTEPSSPTDPYRFTIRDILGESRFDQQPEDTSTNACQYYPALQQPQHVPLPEMPIPTFNESSYLMPEIPINRPHCPVPNTRTFMPPHVFNPQMFPPPPYEAFNNIQNVTYDDDSDLPSPNSSSMLEDQRPFFPVPDTHLHFELPHLLQPQAPTVQGMFNPNEPGPSRRRNLPVPGGISRVPPLAPLAPLAVDIPRTIELTCQQMENLRAELQRVSNIFARLATVVQRKSCAPIPGIMCPRLNPFGRATVEPSNLESPEDDDVSDFGPTKAKQLKTKPTVVKTSKPKAPNATQSNIGLVTIAPPAVQPVNGKSSQLALAILKPSMLTYPGRQDAITQTDPPKYNSFEGLFRQQSSTESDDELDENGNIVNPKRNLKRRHSESDPGDKSFFFALHVAISCMQPMCSVAICVAAIQALEK